MSDQAERMVTAFAKGLMLGILEAESSGKHQQADVPRRGRSRKGALSTQDDTSPMPSREIPLFSAQRELDEAYQVHQAREALRNTPAPELDFEAALAEDSRRQTEPASTMQPGPGETEQKEWLGIS